VLLLVIGLELVRMLVTHSLSAVLELLAFVIARKMLKPDLSGFTVRNTADASSASGTGIRKPDSEMIRV